MHEASNSKIWLIILVRNSPPKASSLPRKRENNPIVLPLRNAMMHLHVNFLQINNDVCTRSSSAQNKRLIPILRGMNLMTLLVFHKFLFHSTTSLWPPCESRQNFCCRTVMRRNQPGHLFRDHPWQLYCSGPIFRHFVGMTLRRCLLLLHFPMRFRCVVNQ